MSATYANRSDGSGLFWLFVLAIIGAIAIAFAMSNTTSNGIGSCSYRGCEVPAKVMMKSPYGTVGAFCDEHSAQMYQQGWRIYP